MHLLLSDKWKRRSINGTLAFYISLICGVCWHKNYICVNIRQMSNLLEKCKSSINGSFQRLCFVVLQNKQQTFKIMTEAIPYLKNHQDLLKMWSVRLHNNSIQNSTQSIPSNKIQTFNIINNQQKNYIIPTISYNQTTNCLIKKNVW